MTVEEYLQHLPADRREALRQVRDVILQHLPLGYVETFNWGMISYEVPLAVYPTTYNKQPLVYAALASQKQHMAVYLNALTAIPGVEETFRAAYAATGKQLDCGKACVRFKKLEHLPLEVLANTIAAVPLADFVAAAQSARQKSA